MNETEPGKAEEHATGEAGREDRTRDRKWVLLLVAMAIALRMAVAMMHPIGLPAPGAKAQSGISPATQAAVASGGEFEDSGDYAALAVAIEHGQPYEVSGMKEVRMPGYPVFVAAIFAISGDSLRAVLLAQAVLGGATVGLTYLLARRMGRGVGLLAAALAAVDPLSVGFCGALLSEIPFAFFLMVGIWLCVRIADAIKPSRDDQGATFTGATSVASLPHGRGSENPQTAAHDRDVGAMRYWMRWIALGIVWGIAVYLRAEALWCIVPLATWAAYRGLVHTRKRGGGWKWLGGAAMAVAVTFLGLSPWLIRNYALYHSGFLRLTSLEGISLYEAVYPGADGGPKQGEIPLPPEMRDLNEAQRNDAWEQRAWGYVRRDPGRMLRLGFIKVARTWSPVFHAADFRSLPIQIAMGIWYVPLLVFGLLGIVNRGVGAAMRGAMLVPLGYFTLLHALFLGSVRYRVALMPAVCILAAAGAAGLVKWMRRTQRQPGRAV